MTVFEIVATVLLAGIFVVNLAGYLETSGKVYRLKKRLRRK